MSHDSSFNLTTSSAETNRNLCQKCHGFRNLCGKGLCPILVRAKSIAEIQKTFSKTDFFGASPPSFFVGEYGYPKVNIGPLVPPILSQDTTIYDAEDQWIFKTINEIIGYRTSLVRGKKEFNVKKANQPTQLLEMSQELVMAEKPVDTEMSFIKRPRLDIDFSPRIPPTGPSGIIKKAILTENPKIPVIVDKVVSDIDLKTIGGIFKLYDDNIPQRQITRLLSAGLFGVKKQRRLVPTTWSITAVDDILGKRYWEKITSFQWINNVQLFWHKALGNLVLALLYPSAWAFEAFEYWLISSSDEIAIDWEIWKGRKTYAKTVAGAYYATRLPILEYLHEIKRQAGCLLFMEVDKEWVPLGVWRFREIAKEALKKKPMIFNTLEQGFNAAKQLLSFPLEKYLAKSKTYKLLKTQKSLEEFLPKEVQG